MKKISLCLLAAFVLWTAAVCAVDVQPVGPMDSTVGFAGLNRWFHGLTGVHMGLYILTDWLSLLPVGLGLGFAGLGLCQWVRRRKLRLVEGELSRNKLSSNKKRRASGDMPDARLLICTCINAMHWYSGYNCALLK